MRIGKRFDAPQNARTHNKNQYDLYAGEYSLKRSRKDGGFWNEFIDLPAITGLLRGEIKGKRVLDIGCGGGIMCGRLRAAGARITGLDNSASMLDIARRDYPEIEFIRAEADRTGLASGGYDTAFAALVAHYFKDLRPFFREAARLLKKGGVFVFSFHHPFNEILSLRFANGKVSAQVRGGYFHNDGYTWTMAENMKLASYHHTMENVVETLAGCGFAVERLREPRPDKSSRKHSIRSYEITSRYPSFCAIKAKKL